MKKIILVFLSVLFLSSSFATEVLPKEKKVYADKVMIPIGNGQQVSLLTLSKLSIKDFEELRGKKLKFADRLIIKTAQKKLRSGINEDGSLKSKYVKTLKSKRFAGGSGFHFGGFALGFFLGLIGVLIAYLINDDLKSSRVRWAWLGLLIAIALSLVLFLV